MKLPIWDDLSIWTRATIHTILFFFAPALVATGFSENLAARFIQTLGLMGCILFGFIMRHDFQNLDQDKGDNQSS